MTVAEFEKSLACLTCWREEAMNGASGMLAVLFLLRARVKAGAAGDPDWKWCQGSWTKVIEGHNQFSSMSVIGDGQLTKYPDPRDPAFIQVMQYIDSVYDDTRKDNLTDGALYYADIGRGITPGGWFERNIIGRPDLHPRTAQVGTTTYFK